MNTSNIIIETKNLFLRGITLDYANDIFREFTPEITVYMFPKPPKKIEDTIAFIETSIKENRAGDNLQIVVINKKSKDFLGCGGLHHVNTKTPELGIWIKKSAHGHGYGKETMIALKEWADKNLDYEYILYPVVDKNYPSRRIPECLGGKIAREYDDPDMNGKKQHILEYRIYPPNKKLDAIL